MPAQDRTTAVDPTAGRRPPRRPGRPARTSMASLLDAAVAVGLDTFTLADVAAHVGVSESTIYNYVPGRDALYDGPDPESIRRAAASNELPVEQITEVRVLDPYCYGGTA